MAHDAAVQNEMAHHAAGRLLNDRERKSRGTKKKEQRSQAHILPSTHFFKDTGVQAHQGAIETDGQEQIRVVIEIAIFRGQIAEGEEDLETGEVDEASREHVNIQGKIASE